MSAAFFVFAALFALVALALALPLLRTRGAAAAPSGDERTAVLRDRLARVDRDLAAGHVDPESAASLKAELARALLAARRESERVAQRSPRSVGRRMPVLLAAAGALSLGAVLYAAQGSFEMALRPAAERSPAAGRVAANPMGEHQGGSFAEAIATLRARLEQDPGNLDNLLLLARSYAATGDHAGAAETYRRVVALAPNWIEIRGDLGEALVLAERGFVGAEAAAAFEIVLAHRPGDPRARYYLALRDAQAGRPEAAVQGWARILREAPPDAPYIPAVREVMELVIAESGLDRAVLDLPAPAVPGADAAQGSGGAAVGAAPAAPAGPGPSAADVAAAAGMPPAEQLEMIRGMVERLEARLAEEPGDVEGWLRLARSRAVLGEREAALATLERAVAANPGEPALATALAEMRAASAR